MRSSLSAQPALRVQVPGAAYRVVFGPGALRDPGPLLARAGLGERFVVLADARVAALYGPVVVRSLRRAGAQAELLVFPPGERSKTLATAAKLYRALVALGADRDTAIVALGGGVTGDLAGFVAATYLRGVPWVALPTTVLAQVDASIGGKTGVDLPEAKNLVGAFHQPRLVLCDPRALATLPPRHYRAGLAEIVKVGAALDARLFANLERDAERLLAHDPAAYLRAAVPAVRAKARIVAQDERERGRRALLNYGHTIGHALETLGGYRRWLHGEAVAMGISAALEIAHRAGIADETTVRRQRELLARLDLPIRLPQHPPRVSARQLLAIAGRDKKARSGRLALVLTRRIGVASVHRTLTGRELTRALRALGAEP